MNREKDIDFSSLRKKGNMYVGKNMYDKAIECYTEVLLKEDNHIIYSNRSLCHFNMGNYGDAIKDAYLCIKTNPEWVKGYYRLGRALMELKDYDKAIGAFIKVLEREPENEIVKGIMKECVTEREKIDSIIRSKKVIEKKEIPEVTFDPKEELMEYHPKDEWFHEKYSQAIYNYIDSHSDVLSVNKEIKKIDDRVYLSPFINYVKTLKKKTVFCIGGALGLLPCILFEENNIYVSERYHYLTKCSAFVIQRDLIKRWERDTDVELFSLDEKSSSFEYYCERLKLIKNNPLELKLGDEINTKSDVMIFYDLDYTLFGTNIIQTIQKFKEDLLVPECQIFPEKAKVYGALVELNANFNRWSVGVEKADISKMNLLSDSFDINCYDFTADIDLKDMKKHIEIKRDGTVHGIVYWYELFHDNKMVYSNREHEMMGQALYYIDPIEVKNDTIFNLEIIERSNRLIFKTDPEKREIKRFRVKNTDNSFDEDYRIAIEKIKETLFNGDSESSGSEYESDSNEKINILEISPGDYGFMRNLAASGDYQGYTAESMRQVTKEISIDDIAVINKDLRECKLIDDIPKKVDILLNRDFGKSLLGGDIMTYIDYAKNVLLKRDGFILPESVTVKGYLVESKSEEIEKVDMTPIDIYRHQPMPQIIKDYKILSKEIDLLDISFENYSPQDKGDIEVIVDIEQKGVICGIVYWYEFNIGNRLVSSEDKIIQYFNEIDVVKGTKIPLLKFYNSSRLTFGINEKSLDDKATILTVSRKDPEVEERYKMLSEFLSDMVNGFDKEPDSYKITTDIIKKLSIDSGNFWLDQDMCGKFCASFFS
jgi:tetratricopeptide (TPR) repeat protein